MEPVYFGVRHLSPSGAWHLRRLLDEKRPKLVLIEGPSDLTGQIPNITRPETVPPFAVLAYTQEAPVRTLLYPLAEYSPEYQAILWAHQQGVPCRFIDLPADVFLSFDSSHLPEAAGEETRLDVYQELDRQAGDDGHETFWERVLEQSTAEDAYRQGAGAFGKALRELTAGREKDWAETVVREAYMRRQIDDACALFPADEIVVVTGSYHVEGLRSVQSMSDSEMASLPRVPANTTLMPYSYYRLSTRSGYGAGNRAPAYYELLWDSIRRGEPGYAARRYLSQIALWQRDHGTPVSSAEVIEAVRLAGELARMRGSFVPALRDLRDAAVTCLGHGELASISLAVADTEIGVKIGSLPDGVSRTSIQEDFYRQLRELKLEKYRSLTAQDLSLDLRENRSVKSEKAAFLDLHRSFFLHQLRVLGVSFAKSQSVAQDKATWAERWALCWTPESEIELVEAALLGDTVALAASYRLKERVEGASGMAEIAAAIEDAFACGIPSAVQYATNALQAKAIDAASMEESAATAYRLSVVLQYGNIRLLDPAPLIPILSQLSLRGCLLLPGCCVCDDNGAKGIITAMDQLNQAELAHDFLDSERWITTLREVARRDDLNTKTSGYAAAILLERGQMDQQELEREVQLRLSKGVPADLGAGWFEGLSMKNRYALIARLPLWQSLSDYLDTLDDEEFKRALLFLRRAFADFTAREKDEIAENLGECWQLDSRQVSEAVNAPLGEEAQQLLEDLDSFDFDL